MARPRTIPDDFKPSSLAEWKRNSVLNVTLSSGTRVTLRPLTLDELAANEALPDRLMRVALVAQLDGGVPAEITRELQGGGDDAVEKAQQVAESYRELRDRLVLASVIAPKITEKDIADIDPLDRAEIAEFCQRLRNVDAAGRRVGADALDTFRSACRVLARSETDPARKGLLLELADLQ